MLKQAAFIEPPSLRNLRRSLRRGFHWWFAPAQGHKGAASAGFYYLFDPLGHSVKKDRDMYKALDVLAKKVGILGIFSDWPATVTYYASCMGMK